MPAQSHCRPDADVADILAILEIGPMNSRSPRRPARRRPRPHRISGGKSASPDAGDVFLNSKLAVLLRHSWGEQLCASPRIQRLRPNLGAHIACGPCRPLGHRGIQPIGPPLHIKDDGPGASQRAQSCSLADKHHGEDGVGDNVAYIWASSGSKLSPQHLITWLVISFSRPWTGSRCAAFTDNGGRSRVPGRRSRSCRARRAPGMPGRRRSHRPCTYDVGLVPATDQTAPLAAQDAPSFWLASGWVDPSTLCRPPCGRR